MQKPLKPLDPRDPKKSVKDTILLYKRLILVFVVIVCIIVTIFIIFTPPKVLNNSSPVSNQSTTVATMNYYDNGEISFNYPLDWNVSSEKVKPPLIVTIYKNENTSVSIYSEKLGNKPFAEYVVGWRDNLGKYGNITYEQVIKVDNSTAYDVQASSRDMNGTHITRDLIFTKNKKVYFIVFMFNKSLLDYKEQMDLIVNSFKVK